jgi:peptide deformylase
METTKLKIHTWPDPALRKLCKEVKVVDDNIRSLLDQMHALMLVNKGVGLAANQVGLDLRLIVAGLDNEKVFKLVNPKIIRQEGHLDFLEGCLSFPGVEVKVPRAKKIWISALDEKGQPLEMEVQGIWAVVFQHEIDHVDGIVFFDRLSFWKKVRSKLDYTFGPKKRKEL